MVRQALFAGYAAVAAADVAGAEPGSQPGSQALE